MKHANFTIHACEQVMRFTRIASWEDLSEAVKVQLGFNMGAMALGLNLSKEDGYMALTKLREGKVSIAEFRAHIQHLIEINEITVDQKMIDRPF